MFPSDSEVFKLNHSGVVSEEMNLCHECMSKVSDICLKIPTLVRGTHICIVDGRKILVAKEQGKISCLLA